MQAVVVDRPVFESATWLRDLIRRNRTSAEPAPAIVDDTPPFAPVSSFVLGDEVIECEEVFHAG